jgi:hypothetical protein
MAHMAMFDNLGHKALSARRPPRRQTLSADRPTKEQPGFFEGTAWRARSQ